MNGALVGFTGNFSAAATGITTINVNGKTGIDIGATGTTIDLSGVTIINGNAIILANRNNQTITGTAAADLFSVQSGGNTLIGHGGDVFELDTPWAYYNTYAANAGTITAGVNGAYVGITGNFSAAATGITTININGKTGIDISATGGTVDLSGVSIINGGAVILANRNNQIFTGTAAADYFDVQSGGNSFTGHGDVFEFDAPWYYNSFKESGATALAGANGALIGVTGNFSAALTGITTLNANGKTGVEFGATGATINLTGVSITNGVVTILANQGNQTITGTAAADKFSVQSGGNTLIGNGGDVFEIDQPWSIYNTYLDQAGTITAGANNVLIGFAGNFSTSANGITTIDATGKTGVTIASTGKKLDLSGVTLLGSAVVLANQSGEAVSTSVNGGDLVRISAANETVYSSAAGRNDFQLTLAASNSVVTGFNTASMATNGGNAAHDVIDLSQIASAPTTWAGIQALLSDSAAGAVLSGDGMHVTIAGVAKSQLSAADFGLPAPVIGGAQANQVWTDQVTGTPFSAMAISDAASGGLETLSVTLGAGTNGALSDPNAASDGGVVNNGTYTVTGTAAQVTAALDGLVFTLTPQALLAGQGVTASFAVAVQDAAGSSAINSSTSLQITAQNTSFVAGSPGATLTGVNGNEEFVLNPGAGANTIISNDTSGVQHILLFGGSVTPGQVWLEQSGTDLIASVLGSTTSADLVGWFGSGAGQVNAFALSNGATLASSEVNTLVQAMAGFTPPQPGQTSLTLAEHTALDGLIASSWVG